MKAFSIFLNGISFFVEPGIHEGFYSVTTGQSAGLLAKNEKGLWVLSLETSEPLGIDAAELGNAIEQELAKQVSK